MQISVIQEVTFILRVGGVLALVVLHESRWGGIEEILVKVIVLDVLNHFHHFLHLVVWSVFVDRLGQLLLELVEYLDLRLDIVEPLGLAVLLVELVPHFFLLL